jgi:hypothetical protein
MLIHCYYSHLNIKDASFFIYINIFGNGSQLMKERGGEKSVCEGWGYCFAGKIDFPLRDGRSEVMESSPHSVTYGFIIAYFCIASTHSRNLNILFIFKLIYFYKNIIFYYIFF